MARLFIRQQALVVFVRGEPDGHLGDNTSQHSTQTLVQTQSSLLLHDLDTGSDEAARLSLYIATWSATASERRDSHDSTHTGSPGSPRELHPDLDSVQRMTHESFHHTGTTTRCVAVSIEPGRAVEYSAIYQSSLRRATPSCCYLPVQSWPTW